MRTILKKGRFEVKDRTISIIGAGISGLTLGRCLLKRNIPAILYERTASPKYHNYGITLYEEAYLPMIRALGVEETVFKSLVAVDAAVGGRGDMDPVYQRRFRAHRGRLEEWLRDGLDIRYSHTLQRVIQPKSFLERSAIAFNNGTEIRSDIIIRAHGPHWEPGQDLSSNTQLAVLPFVAINGKRRIDNATFLEAYAPNMEKTNLVSAKSSDSRLSISIDDHTADVVSLSWTYSRPARGTEDALYKPNRPLAGATDIPDEVFHELATLHRAGLPQPFGDICDPSKLPNDRMLHWLMRSSLAPRERLPGLAKTGVALIGDAAHTQPIVGGSGANAAIIDAVSLATCIANGDELYFWYNTQYPQWNEGVQRAERNIQEMHQDDVSSLQRL